MSQKKASGNKPRSYVSSLSLVATNYAFRCDAKYADVAFVTLEAKLRAAGCFELGDYLPHPIVKGTQPEYLDQPSDDSVPVINTLSIQNLTLRLEDCRHISREHFDALPAERQLKKGDVLLTVDGGVSIGKPYLFNLVGSADDGEEGDAAATVDSHVSILRPIGLSSISLVYLLASPLGQMQFRRAESGASGQTTVTEDDIRRFIFPRTILSTIDAKANHIEGERALIAQAREKLLLKERTLWEGLEFLTS